MDRPSTPHMSLKVKIFYHFPIPFFESFLLLKKNIIENGRKFFTLRLYEVC